jgi:16S rRNA processing protein RimM
VTEKARSSRSSSETGRLTAHPEKGPAHLVVGRVGRAVGLKGEVEVLVLSDDPKRFSAGSVVHRGDTMSPLTVLALRKTRDRSVVSFEEIIDRTAAEALKGAELVIATQDARPLSDDEYWDHDLLGSTVVTVEGTEVGVVTDVLHQPSSELLLVDAGEKELLIPLVASIIKSVDRGRTITIDPPDGLLD